MTSKMKILYSEVCFDIIRVFFLILTILEANLAILSHPWSLCIIHPVEVMLKSSFPVEVMLKIVILSRGDAENRNFQSR